MFISLNYFLFFVITATLYFTLPHRWRWLMLLVASSLLYLSFIPAYIFVMYFLIIIDYTAGILLEKFEGKKRKIFLLISIFSTCSVLFFFKYFNFFGANLELLAKRLDWNYSAVILELAIPIGLSFHTFQSLAYVIEVYRKKQKAERHFGIYALYVMFFPQLMAGPIERPYNMLHQFHEKHRFEYTRVVSGLRLMLWGAFQKVVIADRLASVANHVYTDPTLFTGIPLIVATLAFSVQIFCDFAGYSNIAIGAARVLGLTLMTNFKRPYFSKSVSEFWRRWHISLSSWFRDYVYIPLGGSRVDNFRWTINILITFLLSGLWHGASWTFVIWGGVNGAYILIETWSKKFVGLFVHSDGELSLVDKLVQVGITFCLISFAWIFFRANSLSDAIYVARNLFVGLGAQFQSLVSINSAQIVKMIAEDTPVLGLSLPNWLIVIAAIFLMLALHIAQEKNVAPIVSNKPIVFRWVAYYVLILAIVYYSVGGGQEQFIYFQF